MAHSISAKKRIRQNVRQRARNRARKGQIKWAVRHFRESLGEGDRTKAEQLLRSAFKTIDQVAAKGAMHRNTASRKKARLQKQFNSTVGQS